MEPLKKRWSNIPSSVRKPLVLVVGMTLVIVSPFTGVLPGPGGIPIFLIGVAILATEFEWAERFRDWILQYIKMAGSLWHRHKLIGSFLLLGMVALFITGSIFAYDYIRQKF